MNAHDCKTSLSIELSLVNNLFFALSFPSFLYDRPFSSFYDLFGQCQRVKEC